MKQSSCLVATMWLMASCGQELELPTSSGHAGAASSPVASGVTGSAGDPTEGASAGRLNVPSGDDIRVPGASEGGEGGAADTGQRAHGGRAGEGSRGGRSGASVGGFGTVGGFGAGGEAGTPPPGPRRLLFSEYVEGAGKHKALEIFAFEAASLVGCDLETYFNGAAQPARIALSGDIAAESTYVLCSSALADEQPALCQRRTNLTFNGDDAVALRCEGELLDVIGQIGVDPGAAWGDGETVDHALRRRCETAAGRTDGSTAFQPALEWLAVAEELMADLGRRECPAGQ